MRLLLTRTLLALAPALVPQAPAQVKIPKQYKRVHQKALAQLTKGKLDAALASMQAFADENPADAETHFLLTLIHVGRDDIDAALAAMARAIELDLPAERFVAGPRDLLRKLHGRKELVSLITACSKTPVHGPLVGSVTDTGARVWVRTATEGAVTVAVRRPGSDEIVARATAQSREDRDFTAVAELRGLAPDTEYAFAVGVAGAAPGREPGQRFRTSPRPGAKCRFTLAFGGGAGYVPRNERVWSTIASFEPRLLLLLGDNVYIDAPKIPAMHSYCYYRRHSRPEFRGLLAKTPVYTIWDDHDFGTNDCWGGPRIEKPAWKRRVWRTFRQNWANPAYGGGEEQPGVWYSFSFGDVDFFMLDGRYYRENPKKVAKPSMLGPVQKAWLQKAVRASNATFKVVCSPVPWEFRTKGNSRDTWNGFRDEREEILASFETARIDGIVLMSADRHRSDAWKIARSGGYDLYEFNSSRLTNQHVHATKREAIFSYNAKQSFGLVHFDTTLEDPRVVYEVVTIDGEKVHEVAVKLSQLRHGHR